MAATTLSRRETGRFTVDWADTPEAVEACQRLRYRVFAEELGASVHAATPGLETDRYDRWCRHLMVRDNASGEVVACSRLLDDHTARMAGGFYSEAEFDMDFVGDLPGRIMELGRTCVDPAYRRGASIATLWSGLAGHIVDAGYDYLIGCASIPAGDGGLATEALMRRLRSRHMAPEPMRVRPRHGMPALPEGDPVTMATRVPPLLKAYLSLGARICGEPCWDPDFRVADVFIIVDTQALSARYVRRFLGIDGTAIPHAASA
ncbi:GNAT family N-acetyltransferase [Arhodomonas aquaeolei]|uniref:GNAT family N-acetyltransferase n=1 Tax=Arhodomonas aquaeolei TaxID=2369 RepID=UPI002169AC42|nr:GNAT family N-acyltransferase [Arhodomonas aquaeolei]MCS4504390.1 GNAT family N-acetyltransferase [Arhodomonas aquaeolei]